VRNGQLSGAGAVAGASGGVCGARGAPSVLQAWELVYKKIVDIVQDEAVAMFHAPFLLDE
jgi:hypothetical protein